MYSVIADVISACDPIDGTEIEVRMPIPHALFETVRRYYARGRTLQFSTSTIQWADKTDVRCVDGQWQRKRVAQQVRLHALRQMSLCVSVESPVCKPSTSMPIPWRTMTRERWTHQVGKWTVMFSSSVRNCNVEVEYGSDLSALQSSARQSGDVHDLQTPLDEIVAMLSFTRYGVASEWSFDHMPFVRVRYRACRLPRERLAYICDLMQKCQPVSLSSKMVVPERPLVSAKCDGVRMVLDLRPEWQYGICRKGCTYSIPCLSNGSMVLDCEYVPERHEFIVFDVFELNGRAVTSDYSARLQLLAQQQLPVLANASIRIKTVLPPCVLSETWFADQEHADGIIVHEGKGRLGQYNKLYKWKPVHTVDLLVGKDGSLLDGKYMPFMKACDGHGHLLKKGDIWECAFEPDGVSVRPLVRRRDKLRANARHVCREIRDAHKAALSIEDVRVQLTQQKPRRGSKRLLGT